MAVLALAAVGSAVGAWAIPGTILGMSGAGFGWMVGSMAGSLLFPPKAPDGPRLEDKSVQVSTYGQPIPRLYGTHRMAGNVIWSTDLIETATEEGGKGGPSYTTYSYRASFAVSICQGPIVGIRRIWADGKLIFDQSETNTGPQKDFNAESLAIYLGDESQLPDPTIQALQGDTPAYRGQAYVVFSDLQLEKFGNRLPSLTFEVVQVGTFASPPPLAIGNGNADGDWDPETGFFWTHNSDKTVYVHDAEAGVQKAAFKAVSGSNNIDKIQSIAYAKPGIGFMVLDEPPLYVDPRIKRSFWLGIGLSTLMPSGFFDLAQVQGYVNADSYSAGHGYWLFNGTGDLGGIYVDPESNTFYSYTPGSATAIGAWRAGSLPGPNVHRWYKPDLGQMAVTAGRWQYIVTAGDTRLAVAVENGLGSNYGAVVIDLDAGNYSYSISAPGFSGNLAFGVGFDSARKNVLLTDYGKSFAYLSNIADKNPTSTATVSGLKNPVYDAEKDVWFASRNGNSVVELDPETLQVIRTIDLPGYTISRLFISRGQEPYLLATTTANVLLKIPTVQRLTPLPVPLSDVVTAESDLVGLAPSDIDVSALTSVMVYGFTVSSGGAVRSGLEQLMMAYQFDAVESGGVVKFVRRGGAVVATLDDADLAAHQPGNDVPTPLPLTRAEEIELPQRITIRYPNPAADYQTGAQSAQRLTGRAMAQGGADLPIVLRDDQALQVAEAALYSAWTARISTSFVTTHKHAALEPTDVIVAGGNTLRITKRTENAGLITFDASFEDGSVFTQSALGAAADIPQQTIPLRSRTALEFLDVPPLRDQDDDAGFYVAVSGYAGRWDGAIVYKSLDTGASYTELLSITTAATMGHSIDALTAWTGQNVFDEINSVTIVMRNGTLSSLSELAVLNGGNAALLGEEIIQYKSATLNADGSYTLTGLLRGRKATTTSGHAQGDRFILLNENSLRRAPSDIGELNLSRVYKAATIGTSLSHSNPVSFTNTGKAIDPLAPAHLGGGRSAAGDVAVTWVRRTRIGGAWRDYADVPLSEASESYEVDVFSSGTYATLKRTLTSSTPTVTYTAAQQTTDFGSTQSTVYLRVYQISASAGRGSALQGTV